jgi:hypothetical protein
MKDDIFKYPLTPNESFMSKDWYQQRDELSDEGKRLWDEMVEGAEKRLSKSTQTKVEKRIQHVIVETDETQRLRLELRKLQQNSRIVVKECEELIQVYTKKEEYFKANECKVAVLCHKNFIGRIERVLKGLTAFEKDIKLDEEDNSDIQIRILR